MPRSKERERWSDCYPANRKRCLGKNTSAAVIGVLFFSLRAFQQDATLAPVDVAEVAGGYIRRSDPTAHARSSLNPLDRSHRDDDFETSIDTRHPWAAMCSVMSNEELYVDDWTDYHLALGFQHIYIYDTHPNNTLASWHDDRQTKEARDAGHDDTNRTSIARRVRVVHRIKDNVKGDFQESVYADCLTELRALAHPPKWVMVLDVDEYLVFRDMDRYPNVIEFLTEHVSTGALQINWITMGSGHAISYREEPVTRRFQMATTGTKWNDYTKTIALLDHVDKWNVHDATLKAGYTSIGMGGNPANNAMVPDGNVSIAAIFHYRYKSFDEYNQKNSVRGDIKYGGVLFTGPTFVQTGERWDDAAWKATQRLQPKYATLDSSSSWSPVRVDNDPSPWAALCAVVPYQDERYIDEWIDYHFNLGFEHIYIYGATVIYNDPLSARIGKRQYKEAHEDSAPSTRTARRVEVLSNSGADTESLLSHCLGELRRRVIPPKWAMVLGVDEFLVLRDMKRHPNVVAFLSEHLTSGSLQISRVVMGSANETKYKDVPVTQRFQFAVRGSHHPETKPVVVLDHIEAVTMFHGVPKTGFNSVGMGGRVASPECCINNGDVSVAAVYHYMYKSVREYSYVQCTQNGLNCTPEVETGDVFDSAAWQAMMRLVPRYDKRKKKDADRAKSRTGWLNRFVSGRTKR